MNYKRFFVILALFGLIGTSAYSCKEPTLEEQYEAKVATKTQEAVDASWMTKIAELDNPSTPTATFTPTAAPANPVMTAMPVLDNDLKHLAYWTTQTEAARWPNLEDFDIVICHGDPDQQGNATAVILVKGSRSIAESDLSLIYFNGYSGEYSLQNHNQIVTEVQDSVRPHVPGFTLTNVTVIFLP